MKEHKLLFFIIGCYAGMFAMVFFANSNWKPTDLGMLSALLVPAVYYYALKLLGKVFDFYEKKGLHMSYGTGQYYGVTERTEGGPWAFLYLVTFIVFLAGVVVIFSYLPLLH